MTLSLCLNILSLVISIQSQSNRRGNASGRFSQSPETRYRFRFDAISVGCVNDVNTTQTSIYVDCPFFHGSLHVQIINKEYQQQSNKLQTAPRRYLNRWYKSINLHNPIYQSRKFQSLPKYTSNSISSALYTINITWAGDNQQNAFLQRAHKHIQGSASQPSHIQSTINPDFQPDQSIWKSILLLMAWFLRCVLVMVRFSTIGELPLSVRSHFAKLKADDRGSS